MKALGFRSGGKSSTSTVTQKKRDNKRSGTTWIKVAQTLYEERSQVKVTLPHLQFMEQEEP